MNTQEEDYKIVLTPATREIVDNYLAKKRLEHIELEKRRRLAKEGLSNSAKS